MSEIKWIKLSTEMFDNRKIKYLRKLPDGNNIVLIWVMLLTMAGRCNSGGMIFLTENIPYTTKMLADELDFEENTVALALNALEQLNMIITDNGYFSIAGWEEHQNIDGLEKIREQTRKRVAEHRQIKRLAECNVTGNVTVTQCNDVEEEEEEEKEFHSFILANKDELKQEYLGGKLGGGVVLLSQEQFDDLLDKLSFDEVNKYIGIVRDNELAGHHYKKKTHYQAILDMAEKDRRIAKRKEAIT